MSSERDLPRSFVALALAVHAIAVLAATWRYVVAPHGFPYGDDMSSHVAEVAMVARYLLRLDLDFWFPHQNLGYPMFLAYQPLPSLLGGVLVALTPLEPAGYVKGANVLLWSLVPATWFLGARWLGLSRIQALAFGLLVTHVSDWRDFGLGVESVAYKGLFTQSFGTALLPLALGSFHRKVVLGEGRWSDVVVLQWLTWMSHVFFGLFGSIAGALLVVAAPTAERARRAAIVFSATALSIACWVAPMLLNRHFQGGLPWHNASEDGYPWRDLLTFVREGKLFDFDRELPVLTIVVSIGVALLPLAWRTFVGRWATLLLFASAFLFLGRTNLGPVYASIPFHAELEVIRYLSAVQLAAILAAALAIGRLLVPLLGERVRIATLLALVAALGQHAVLQYRECHKVFRTWDTAAPDYARLVASLEGRDGRYLGHKRFESAGHFVLNLAGHLAGRPHLESFSRGYHDTLSLFYVEMFRFKRIDFRLYDVTTVVTSAKASTIASELLPPEFQLSHLEGRYAVFDAPPYGWFDFVRTPVAVSSADPKAVRPLVTELVQGMYPKGTLPIFTAEGMGVAEDAPATAEQVARSIDATPIASRVLEDRAGDNEFAATVEAAGHGERLVLKASYHPYWRAEVDGIETPVLHVGPNLQAIDVPPGRHAIDFRYRLPLWQKALWIMTLVAIAGCFAAERTFRRRDLSADG
jgi:hypothetical protein